MKNSIIAISIYFSGCVLFDSRQYLLNREMKSTGVENKIIKENISALPENSKIVINPFAKSITTSEKNIGYVNVNIKNLKITLICKNLDLSDSIKFLTSKKIKWYAYSNNLNMKYEGITSINDKGVIEIPVFIYSAWNIKIEIQDGLSNVMVFTQSLDSVAEIICDL